MTDKELRELAKCSTQDQWRMAAKPSSVVGWPIITANGRAILSLHFSPGKGPEHDAYNAEQEANGKLIVALKNGLDGLLDRLIPEGCVVRCRLCEMPLSPELIASCAFEGQCPIRAGKEGK